jgi:hypothetical protein
VSSSYISRYTARHLKPDAIRNPNATSATTAVSRGSFLNQLHFRIHFRKYTVESTLLYRDRLDSLPGRGDIRLSPLPRNNDLTHSLLGSSVHSKFCLYEYACSKTRRFGIDTNKHSHEQPFHIHLPTLNMYSHIHQDTNTHAFSH